MYKQSKQCSAFRQARILAGVYLATLVTWFVQEAEGPSGIYDKLIVVFAVQLPDGSTINVRWYGSTKTHPESKIMRLLSNFYGPRINDPEQALTQLEGRKVRIFVDTYKDKSGNEWEIAKDAFPAN